MHLDWQEDGSEQFCGEVVLKGTADTSRLLFGQGIAGALGKERSIAFWNLLVQRNDGPDCLRQIEQPCELGAVGDKRRALHVLVGTDQKPMAPVALD